VNILIDILKNFKEFIIEIKLYLFLFILLFLEIVYSFLEIFINKNMSSNENESVDNNSQNKTKKIRKGRKRNPISNFLLITYKMIDVILIRILKQTIQFNGHQMEILYLLIMLKNLLKSCQSFLRPKTILHL
jgi:hypothetical protein